MENFFNFSNKSLIDALVQLGESTKNYISTKFVYLYLDADNPKNRLLLRNLVQKHGSLYIILVSANQQLASLAWKSNVFHFLHITDTELVNDYSLLKDRLLQKFDQKQIPKKLKIPFKGGLDVIDIREICFCSGEGNYTTLYLSSGIKKTVTLQLNALEKKLCTTPEFQRIGKSIIINLNKIAKIKENTVSLNTQKEPINLSLGELYIKRLKKKIMWY